MWKKRLTGRVASFGVQDGIVVMLWLSTFLSLERHHPGELYGLHHPAVQVIIELEEFR